jgi:prepilin-type N-terminal cleavage/methylation domain-containing protein
MICTRRHVACRRGFTLVELLVVLAIIVVLLALLAPAMEKAIYEAELATCGGNLHGVITGTLTYAMNYKRAYPVRVAIQGGSNWSPTMIYNGNAEFRAFWSVLSQGLNVNADIFDDRLVLRQFMSLKSLVDPLTGKVDFEATDEDANAFSSIGLWFGFGIARQQALNRIGDRWTWNERKLDGSTRLWSFDVVVGDVVAYSGSAVQSGHPDDAGVMANYTYQNTDFRDTPGFKTVATVWEVIGDPWRVGPMDLNFAHDDGSLSRYREVEYRDPRFPLPMYYNTIPGWSVLVPGR